MGALTSKSLIGQGLNDISGSYHSLRFLIASCPEPHICRAISILQPQFPDDRVSVIDLNQDALVHRDIQHYFMMKFAEIRAMHPYLPADWPSLDVIAHLLDSSHVCYVYV